MTFVENPFRPGAGLPPPHLAGREAAMRVLRDAQTRINNGEGANPILVTGLRGMGKTVLLNSLRDDLRPDGWLVPAVERFTKQQGVRELWPRLMSAIEQIQPAELVAKAGRQWSTDSLSWSVGGSIGTSGASATAQLGGSASPKAALATEDLTAALLGFAGEAGDLGVRVAVLFDEAHLAGEADLAALAEVGQACAERSLPLLVILAGLRPLHDNLVKSREYASRFPILIAGPLQERDALDALRIPVGAAGGQWDVAALDAAIDFAKGVPFHVQVIGKECVDAVDPALTISYRTALDAIPRARASITEAMYQPLWRLASPAEQRYLVAMVNASRNNEGSAVADIAASLTKKITAIAPVRQRLIDKGLIHGTRYGRVDFSYPGFDDFVREEKGLSPESF